MQWDDSANAGFTTGTPWIGVNRNYHEINAAQSTADDTSIFYYYQKLIQMRKNLDVIAYGDFAPLVPEHDTVFAYERTYQGEKLAVICNFYGKETQFSAGCLDDSYECILSNYEKREPEDELKLKPYEALVFYKGNGHRE